MAFCPSNYSKITAICLSLCVACSGTEVNQEAPASHGADTPTEHEDQDPVAKQPTSKLPADTYIELAEGLLAAIETKSDDAKILSLADELTMTGLGLLPIVEEKHPICKEYLAAVAAVATTLKDLPLEDIETDYHADGKLPPTPAPACYHGKDLVVHPATAAAMAKAGIKSDEEREAVKHEIVEVLEHLNILSVAPRQP